MAARTRRTTHHAEDKNKIRASQLLNLLYDNALGKLKTELSAGRIRSIEAFCKKYLPDLAATSVDVTSQETVRYYAEVPQPIDNVEEWVKGNPVTKPH